MTSNTLRIDMHVHSTASDGSKDPAEVVGVAKLAGLDAIALTDHDTLSGLKEAREAAAVHKLTVHTGCEVSAVYEGSPVHVLGYFMDESHPRLNSELSAIRDDRVRRAKAMVDKLRALGVDITFERVRAFAKGDSVGRPHVARAMVEAGTVGSLNEAFTPEWIATGGRAYEEKRALTPQAAVDLINEAGGVAVIAHPIWYEHDDAGLPPELIESLARNGLAGLEVEHPDHDGVTRQRFGAMARDLGLIPTGSSDYHGNDRGPVIAANLTPPDSFEALSERAERNAATERS